MANLGKHCVKLLPASKMQNICEMGTAGHVAVGPPPEVVMGAGLILTPKSHGIC